MSELPDTSSVDTTSDLRPTADALITTARSEITNRSTLQQGLLALNVTLVSAVAAFVPEVEDRLGILALLTAASAVFGAMWLDHHRVSARIAKDYLAGKVWRSGRTLEEFDAKRMASGWYLWLMGLGFALPALTLIAAHVWPSGF